MPTTVKAFLNWCIQRDIVETNPAASVKKPTVETGRERVLSNAELGAILGACSQHCLRHAQSYARRLRRGCRVRRTSPNFRRMSPGKLMMSGGQLVAILWKFRGASAGDPRSAVRNSYANGIRPASAQHSKRQAIASSLQAFCQAFASP